jgi:hypothetical protein
MEINEEYLNDNGDVSSKNAWHISFSLVKY